ncbi:hypothetical protein [Cognatishimia activa]|uniref:Uncharacterized protein n=1 Tax=Cognatishimia activa TaxID=1715691 RepID=A0A0P1IPZ4_9RHOB|nr:hypothetical protein [Cognatishimia activa]CUI87341.1 hypothetical protein TA5113_01671 [Cognatishimia activa]CUK25610.1 hypothetical protein TA5114_01411 [Cognatishimia activa]
MRRVLPMIFTCFAIVGYAVFQAHAVKAENHAQYIPTATPIEIEHLTY